uniref:Uncharacterized protein n=1 Tax=Otus sunia TaxID=257818 RepID=A0A8C8E8X5_9STRI
ALCSPSETEELREGEVKLPGSCEAGERHFIKDHSKANVLPVKIKKASSFHEFVRNTNDVWDIGDDADEDFSSSSSLQTLNSKVAEATAAQVLENHSKLHWLPVLWKSPSRSLLPAGDIGSPSPPLSRWGWRGADSVPTSPQHLLLAEEAGVRTPLQKQQSLPLRPIIPLIARISDQNASGAPPVMLREKTRLERFWQLLSSHNMDLGECGRTGVPAGGKGKAEGTCCLLQVAVRSALAWVK